MKQNQKTAEVTLLDGGMGRELKQMGAPFRQPEWSALSLMEAPDLVRAAHEKFAAAGSDILTTNNYAVVPFHIGNEGFANKGKALTALSGQLAAEVAHQFGCKVAGSLPPLFGSYRPDLFQPAEAMPLLRVIIDALNPYADIFIAETISSITEARTVDAALENNPRPRWYAFTLCDEGPQDTSNPHLRSGESVAEAVKNMADSGASAILFNCSQPEVMASAVETALRELQHADIDIPVGVYANAFPPQQDDAQANLTLLDIRSDLDPNGYLAFVERWHSLGATIIGGCCGIGPEHIAALRARFDHTHHNG